MKAKKLLSAIIAVAMTASAFASVANAAFKIEFDGEYYNIQDADDISARAPYVETVVTPLSGTETAGLKTAYPNLSWAGGKKFGTTAGKYGDETAYKGYKIEGTVKGIGDLVRGYDLADSNLEEYAYLQLQALDATIDFGSKTSDDFAELQIVTSTDTVTGATWTGGMNGSLYSVQLQPANPVPSGDGIIENPEFKFTMYAVVAAGTTIPAEYSATNAYVMYKYSNMKVRETGYSSAAAEVKLASNSEKFTLGTVAKDPESVTITGDAAAIAVGATKALTATVAPSEADQTITWTSDNTAVATVSNGTVTAVAPGKATIKAASSKAGVEATVEIKVLPKVTGADDVAEYEGTYIWKNVTINGAKYGTNYEVTFAADGAEKTKALDISAIEVGGDVSFPILLKGAPAAPTATIGCDWIDAQ